MKAKTKRSISLFLSLLMLLMSIPFSAVSAAENTASDSYLLVDANELMSACSRGEVKQTKENDYVPVLRIPASSACKSSYPAFFFNKTTLGIPSTGDGSLFDYSHYVIRYATSGDARTSDTVNLRGNFDGTGYEKYGGNDQVIKSDDFTIKTIDRDSFERGTTVGVLATKAWTDQYLTLKIFEDSATTGYIDIDFIALCKSADDAEAFITAYNNGEIVREYEKPEQSPINATYSKINSTLTSTAFSSTATYFSPDDLFGSSIFGCTSDMNVTLESENGEKYINFNIPADTYNNNSAFFNLAAHLLDFNVVTYKYMKMCYEADYSKTLDMSANPYTNSEFSGETWLSGYNNPSTQAGVEKEYILDLTKLCAKTDITADYSKFNIVCKLLGSGNKTTDSDVNFKLKYIAFFPSEAAANSFDPASNDKASCDLTTYDTSAVKSEIAKYSADYLEINVPVSSATSELEVTAPSELFTAVKQSGAKLDLKCGSIKLTFDTALCRELASDGSDITITISYTDKGADISLSSENGELVTTNSARVLYTKGLSDESAVMFVDNELAPASGMIGASPAVSTTLPASVSYKTGLALTFDDTASHWASSYIDFMTARKLYKGISDIEFAPNGSMTRSMIATVLMRLAGENTNYASCSFNDVASGTWYYNAVEWAAQNGISDVTSGSFRPDEPIKREELAVFIANYADAMGLSLEPAAALTFSDKADITNTDAVGVCVANNIINGYPEGNFKPAAGATRAEVSAMISRLIKASLKGNEIDLRDYQDVKFDSNNVVLSFVSMSDIHIDTYDENNQAAINYKNAFDIAYDLSETGDLDLLFAAGDLVQNIAYDPTTDTNGDGVIDQDDHSRLFEIDAFKTLTDKYMRDDTFLLYCTGNHDRSGRFSYEDYFYNAFTSTEEDKERYFRYDVVEDCDYEKGNRHAIVNGYHFISVGFNQNFVEYVKPLLEEITAEDPLKPVFVQYHYHAAETVYSTYYAAGEGQADIKNLLNNYPQVIYFSGHTHNALENPRAIWQGNFTAIDTASVRYLDDNSLINFTVKIPVNATHNEVFAFASEATLVEVDANNNIRFRAYNTYRGDVVNEFVVAAPNENGTHLLTYTNDRADYSSAPVFARNAEFTLERINADQIKVHFSQATHEEQVWYYTITFKAPGEEAQTFYFTTRYYDKNGMPEFIDCALFSDSYYVSRNDNHAGRGHKLTEGVTYTATLTAYDAWENASEPIVIDYTA